MKRRKMPYLVNPINPMVSLHPHIRVWRDPVTGKFGDKNKKRKRVIKMRKISQDVILHPSHQIPSAYKHTLGWVPRTSKKIHKRIARKAVKTLHLHQAAKAKRIKDFVERMARARKAKAMKHVTRAVKRHVAKKHTKRHTTKVSGKSKAHRSKKMAKRKSRKHSKRTGKFLKNPFTMAALKGFVSTDLLIDGALVAGGMVASKFAIDFAGAKLPMLATPYGRIGGRVVLGLGVLAAGKYIGKRYAEPLALGFIAPAMLDVVEQFVPALLPAGGVRLNSGYMPDVQSTVSLEQGYMPDVQMESGYMPDVQSTVSEFE